MPTRDAAKMDTKDASVMHPIQDTRVRRIIAVLGGVGLLHIIFAWLTWDGLPFSIPVHFDIYGRADGFSGPSASNWFLLWFCSVGLAIPLTWISLCMDRIPLGYLNIPRKDLFLALDTMARSRVYARLAFHILILTLLMMVFFFILHIGIACVAYGFLKKLPIAVLYGGVALIVGWGIVITLSMARIIEKEAAFRLDSR